MNRFSIASLALAGLILVGCATCTDAFKKQISEQEGTIANLKSQLEEQDRVGMTDLRNQVAARDGSIQDLEAKLAISQKSLDDLAQKVAALQADLDAYMPLQAKVADLQSELAAKDSTIAQYAAGDSKLQDLLKRFDQVQKQLSELQTLLSAREATLKDLRQQAAIKDSMLKDLQDQKFASESQIARLTNDADQAVLRINAFEKQSKDLASRQSELDALKAKLTELQKTNAGLLSDLEAFKTGNTRNQASYLSQISSLNKDKSALQDQVDTLSRKYNDAIEQPARDLDSRVSEFKKIMAEPIANGNVEIRRYRDVLVISVKDSVLFPPDSARLQPESIAILKALSQVFKLMPDRMVRVEGNTAVAISSAEALRAYPTSWHLGSSRAANVVRYLQEECSVDPRHLVAVSRGEYNPKSDNASEAGKMINRRVEFVMVSKAMYEINQLVPIATGD
ncbi:MAG: OmpA family protein [Rectinemataceae bacterium]